MFNHIILFNFSEYVKDNNKEEEAFEVLKASVSTLNDIKYVEEAKIYLNKAKSSDLVFVVKTAFESNLELYKQDPIHVAHAKRMQDLVLRVEVINYISE